MRTRREIGVELLILGLLVLMFFVGRASVKQKTTTVTKTVTVRVPSSTTTTIPWPGVRCMVKGFEIKTDLAHAEEAGCQ